MHNARRPGRWCAIALLLLLAGCAGLGPRTPLPASLPALATPLPLTLHIERREGDRQADWLLLLQREGDALRWSLFDPLGQPLARQLLRQPDGWQRDGLLPPNAEAQALFAAVLFALTPEPALAASYRSGQWSLSADGSRRLAPDWQIAYGAPGPDAARRDATHRHARQGRQVQQREVSEPAMDGTGANAAPAFTLTRGTLRYRVTSLVSERP